MHYPYGPTSSPCACHRQLWQPLCMHCGPALGTMLTTVSGVSKQLKIWGCALALRGATKNTTPMKTANMPRPILMTTPFPPRKGFKDHDLTTICNVSTLYRRGAVTQLKMFPAITTLILLRYKKCNGQVRVALSSDPVMYTIVASLLGTNSGVALQWARNSHTSSQGLQHLMNA